jgi:hypothetical protein
MIESVVPIQVEKQDDWLRVTATVTEVGGKTYKREFFTNSADPASQIRDMVTVENARESRAQTAATGLSLNVPIDLSPKAPPDPVPPTAQQIWTTKANRLTRARGMGLTSQKAVDDLATLEADVNATYVTGYL